MHKKKKGKKLNDNDNDPKKNTNYANGAFKCTAPDPSLIPNPPPRWLLIKNDQENDTN